MYNLPIHKANHEQDMLDFIGNNPFAFLTGVDGNQKPIATQVPLFIESINGRKVLRGHFMKNTDHHKAFSQNPRALAVFSGKHTYVSATWYTNPNKPSTWNYMSIHVQGNLRFVPKSELEDILQMTSLHFENQDTSSPTVYQNLPDDFKQRALDMIVGFEIEIENIDSVFKLSQDRDAVSYQNIIEKLKTGDADAQEIAREMEIRKNDVYT